MKIAITGALGHIGSQLIRDLPGAFPDSELILIDNLSTQRYCSLFDLPATARYRFVHADILDMDLDRAFAGTDAVIHLAAATNAEESFFAPREVERSNLEATRRVAAACVRAHSPLVYPSTTSVYGMQSGLVDENCPEEALRPQSPYAVAKLQAERALEALAASDGLRFVTCRLGTIFGTSPGMRFHTAINKFCWQAATGRPLTVWRTAVDQERPYLDLGDAIRALIFILRRDLFDSRVYNVVTLNTSIGHIVGEIRRHVPELEVQYVDSPIMNQLSYRVDSRRFAGLGFDFSGNICAGIQETLQRLDGLNWGARVVSTE